MLVDFFDYSHSDQCEVILQDLSIQTSLKKMKSESLRIEMFHKYSKRLVFRIIRNSYEGKKDAFSLSSQWSMGRAHTENGKILLRSLPKEVQNLGVNRHIFKGMCFPTT